MDKTEAISEIKKRKWQTNGNSNTLAHRRQLYNIQDIYTEVGKINCQGEEDIGTFAVMNQLFSGHTILNNYRSKIINTVSELCETCKESEDKDRFLFHCQNFIKEKNNWKTEWKIF